LIHQFGRPGAADCKRLSTGVAQMRRMPWSRSAKSSRRARQSSRSSALQQCHRSCAVGMAVILNPFAGRFVDDLRPLFEQGQCSASDAGTRQVARRTGRLIRQGRSRWRRRRDGARRCLRSPDARQAEAVISSNVKVAAAGATLDVPLGHKDDPWSFPHFDTITVSVAAPHPNEILVIMATADGGGLRNRCGIEPIR